MDAIAYARLQGWVAKYTQIAESTLPGPRQDREDALAGHLRAAARSLAAAAARKVAAEARLGSS